MQLIPTHCQKALEVAHIDLNEGTCAGLMFPAMNAMSIQYHPEASPGPHDSDQGTPCSHPYMFHPFWLLFVDAYNIYWKCECTGFLLE